MYGIVCDARKGDKLGIENVALVDRNKTKRQWWTSDDITIIKRFNSLEIAKQALERIRYNNPCIMESNSIHKLINRQNRHIEQVIDYEDDQGWDAHK